MRMYAHLLFAVFVLGARAATIPYADTPELEKKTPRVVPEETIASTDNAASELDAIAAANTVKDEGNNLRTTAHALEDIPVQVIADNVEPSTRTSSEEKNFSEKVLKEEILPIQVDFKNTGQPLGQEHTTELSSSSNTHNNPVVQLMLRQSIQGVTDEVQNGDANKDHVIKLQSSIKNLKEKFSTQVQKFNESIQSLVKFEPIRSLHYDPRTRASLLNLGTRLNNLQNTFNAGVTKLAEGVDMVGSLRAEGDSPEDGDDPSSSSNTEPSSDMGHPYVILVSLFSNLQSSVSSGMANVAQTMNNIMTNETDPGWYLNLVSGASSATSMNDPPVEGGTSAQGASSGKNPQDSRTSTIGPTKTTQSTQRTRSTKPPQLTQSTSPPTQWTQPTQSTWPTQPTQPPKLPGPFAAFTNIPNQIFHSIQSFIKGPNQSTKNLALESIAVPASNQGESKEIPESPSQQTELKQDLEKNTPTEKSLELLKEQKVPLTEQKTELEEIPTLVSDMNDR